MGYKSRDRIVVSTLRCGRSNPGSNPGHGSCQKAVSAGTILFYLALAYTSVNSLLAQNDFLLIFNFFRRKGFRALSKKRKKNIRGQTLL